MASGLFLQVRRSQYFTGVYIAGTNAIAAALGSTILAGDELWEGNGQTRYGICNQAQNAIILTPN